MHKYEVGQHRPTEIKAGNSIHSQGADEWVAKVDKAASIFGADPTFKIKAVSEVLEELANEIRVGRIEREVMINVMRRRDCYASLELLKQRMARRNR